MIEDFFSPVHQDLIDFTENLLAESIGCELSKHSDALGFPDLEGVQVVFFDVKENRGSVSNEGTGIGADEVRKQLYALYPGNWKVKLADLGTIERGNSTTDTYYAVENTIAFLLKKSILPIIIGGSKELIYANYKAYHHLDQVVNLCVASPDFSLGNAEEEVDGTNFLSKIVLEQPSILFNYINLGYQTYYSSQSQIDLMDQLSFETYRLGLLNDITIAEPVMRDADMVAFDVSVIKNSVAPANANGNPNGVDGAQICALARYAGISDKVSSFGIYEYNKLLDNNFQTAKLLSQVIWYFIEGYSLRKKDYPFCDVSQYNKYIVLHDGEEVVFFQSNKSDRWWIELELLRESKYKRQMLIPCTKEDYALATQGRLSERWFKALKKL